MNSVGDVLDGTVENVPHQTLSLLKEWMGVVRMREQGPGEEDLCDLSLHQVLSIGGCGGREFSSYTGLPQGKSGRLKCLGLFLGDRCGNNGGRRKFDLKKERAVSFVLFRFFQPTQQRE